MYFSTPVPGMLCFGYYPRFNNSVQRASSQFECREALWLNFWLKKTLILHFFLFVVSSHLRFGLVWCCSARRNGRELWVVHRNSQFTQFFGNAQHSYRCTVVHSRMSKNSCASEGTADSVRVLCAAHPLSSKILLAKFVEEIKYLIHSLYVLNFDWLFLPKRF